MHQKWSSTLQANNKFLEKGRYIIHAPDFEFFCSRFLYFAPEIEIEILKLKLAISIPGACS